MSEEVTKSRIQEAKTRGCGDICVPASIQFILPNFLVIPQSIYEQASRENGIYPDEFLNSLKDEQWITYQGYSIPKEEMQDYFADHIKSLISEGVVLGVGLSVIVGEEPHFIGVKGPLLKDNKTIKAFDTTFRNPVSWRNLDILLSQAEAASHYGRTNVWCIYPGKLSRLTLPFSQNN